MARKRSLDPDLWTSDGFAGLDLTARLVFIGCISLADDEGRLELRPRQLRIRLGLVEQSDEEVGRAIDAIVAAKLLLAYRVDGLLYGLHPRWKDEQYVNRPTKSRLPAPSEGSTSDPSATPLPQSSLTRHGVGSEMQVPSESESESESENRNRERVAVATLASVAENIDFGDLEGDVTLFLATVAGKNQSKTISQERLATIRHELSALFRELDDRDAFAYGLRAAVRAEASAVNYVRKAAEGHCADLKRTGNPPPPQPFVRQYNECTPCFDKRKARGYREGYISCKHGFDGQAVA
jgi:hypothetical protein